MLFAPIWIELIELLRSSDGLAVCGLSRMMTGLVSVRAELGLSRPDDFPKSLSSIPVPPIPTRGRVALTDRSLPVFLLLRRLARPERSSDESLPEYSSEEYLSVFAELRLFVERAARFVELSASKLGARRNLVLIFAVSEVKFYLFVLSKFDFVFFDCSLP